MRAAKITFVSFVYLAALQVSALAQGTSIEGGALAEISIRALSVVSNQERSGARKVIAYQIGFLPPSVRTSATDLLFSKLRSNDQKSKNDVVSVLGALPAPWATSNTESDSAFLYQMLAATSEDTLKALIDSALANARGLYQDGIRRFNSMTLAEVIQAEPRLKAMVDKYPNSRYAERAGFYLGQTFSKRVSLNDSEASTLFKNSNAAFEEYIKRAERGDFDKRTEYLAAGYFYRALNGWQSKDIIDAQKWMSNGQKKFSDNDRVYVYQLFPSRERSAVLDRYFPAKALFSSALAFFNQTPTPTTERAPELINQLRQLP